MDGDLGTRLANGLWMDFVLQPVVLARAGALANLLKNRKPALNGLVLNHRVVADGSEKSQAPQL